MSTTQLIVQIIGVGVTSLSVVAALTIAVLGNRAADRRAEADRAESRRAAQYARDVDMLERLTQNLERGGSSDPVERARMGVEAITLLVALAEERLPLAYQRRAKMSLDEIRATLDDPSVPEWRQAANEVLLELRRTLDEERAATAKHEAERPR